MYVTLLSTGSVSLRLLNCVPVLCVTYLDKAFCLSMHAVF
jgi:hypothetical protein